jgi:16S rRNA (cytosine967-C5)-methyltransferase
VACGRSPVSSLASGPPRRLSSRRQSRPTQPGRPAPADRPRLVAYQVLRAVSGEDAYANLVLPSLITEQKLTGRDAGLATELGYGTLRASGTLDAIIATCLDRPFDEVQTEVQDLLRLGAYQALRTRIPAHAAVATTVDLARATGNGRAAGFLNAVLRKVTAADWDAWTDRLAEGGPAIGRLALQTAHPRWIAEAFADALGGDLAETEAALTADDLRPQTHLVAWPGRTDRDELVTASGGAAGPYSPYAVRMSGGDPAALTAVHERVAGVQDEGSQLCAIAVTRAPLEGRDERWLDLCAGPGGKTAMLAALAAERGATVTANELHPHRAELVRKVCAPWQVDVLVGDARELEPIAGGWDRVLVDAPCTGLGALRRRPEARWRRQPEDVAELAALQRELLDAALRLVRPGGVVAYVTCSPHPAETIDVVAGHELLDARAAFQDVDQLGAGPTVQLWPHRHGTDAMFCALIHG